MPRISVIVPVYNAAAYLDECVASVVGQTMTDWELLLVEDGSNDGSAEMCAAYPELYPDRAIYSISTVGNGVSDARNTGLDRAKGDYIVFLDADDAYSPDAFEKMLRKAEQGSDIVVAQFRRFSKLESITVSGPEAIEATLYQRPGFHESVWGKLYNRRLFDSGIRFESGRRYEDLEITPRIYAGAGAITVLPDVLYIYAYNPNSFLNNWTDDRLDAIWAVNRIADNFASTCVGAATSRRFSAYFNIFNLSVANGRDDIAAHCWQAIRAMRKTIVSDRQSRLRNRVAAVLSYFGMPVVKFISKTLTTP